MTVEAPINIAFVKYWGKRAGGEELILPTNDSFSITLSTVPFRSKTSVLLCGDLADDELWLNGTRSELTSRLRNVLRIVREASPRERAEMRVLMVSNNNFPTAAGMASSASGYCAMAQALVRAFDSKADVSLVARIGSGSACRSCYGGFVMWRMGQCADGSDSIAQQFADSKHWPDMTVLCVVLRGEQKDVSSTRGMQLSIATSPMMEPRIKEIVNERMLRARTAITSRNFAEFAEIAMTDSDDLQKICATTVPPIQYATADSYDMIRLVKAYNAARGSTKLAYTFDAGPNCFLFCLKHDVPEVCSVILQHYPTSISKLKFHSDDLLNSLQSFVLDPTYHDLLGVQHEKKSLEYLLQSPVGEGPRLLQQAESLIDIKTRRPVPVERL